MSNHSNFKKAAIYMVIYAIIQSVVWGIVRHLGADLSTSVLFFFRNLIGAITITPLLLTHGIAVLQTNHIKLHLLRAFAALTGGASIFYAVLHAPLATVVAITFLAPILSSLFALVIFNEILQKSQLPYILLSFIGVFIVLRPDFEIDAGGLISALLAAIMTAVAFLTIKKLTQTEKSPTVIIYPFLFILPVSSLMAYFDWTPIKTDHLPYLGLMGIGISAAQYYLVKALSLADASAVLPFDYLRLVVAIIIGSIFFNDVIDLSVLLGASLILTSSFFLSRERKEKHDK